MFSSPPDLRRPCAFATLGLALLATVAAAGVPNPMRPPGRSSLRSPAAPVWKLEAILHGRGRRVAVIDDHLVRPGTVVAGARVLRIGRTSVVLRQGRRIFVLHVLPAIPAAFRPLAPGASIR